MKRRFYHSIQFKLFLVSLSLLSIPWAGYRYIQETELFLRQAVEDNLLSTAQAIATVLNNRPELFSAEPDYLEKIRKQNSVYVISLDNPIHLDGYTSDWNDYLQHKNVIKGNKGLSLSYLVGIYKNSYYLLLDITDKNIVYRNPTYRKLSGNDHINLLITTPEGDVKRYTLATSAPGWVNGFLTAVNHKKRTPDTPDVRIKGEWLETANGYRLEVRLPKSYVNNRMAIQVADVNDPKSRKIEQWLLTQKDNKQLPGYLIQPATGVTRILEAIQHDDALIWVVDRKQRILAKKGTLSLTRHDKESWSGNLIQRLFGWILTPVQLESSKPVSLDTPEIRLALQNKASVGHQFQKNTNYAITTAAWPLTSTDGVLGAVVVQQNNNKILSLQDKALERIFAISFILFIITSLLLLGFSSILASRIRQLRNHTEEAVTPDGRILSQIKPATSADEIGDLSRSFSSVLKRISEYNQYLEAMASRLSHELRTPLSIVNSSLDNLAHNPEQSERYLERARAGTHRLSIILQKIREATRLENIMRETELIQLPLNDMLIAATETYQDSNPGIMIQSQICQTNVVVNANPELLIQALDKLIANAIDFHTADTAIIIRLDCNTEQVCIKVDNQGPLLPESIEKDLFKSMVSHREDCSDEHPHLGLGLYLTRLIAEFHQGNIIANNLPDKTGVSIGFCLPMPD